jgi:hypothetical protein
MVSDQIVEHSSGVRRSLNSCESSSTASAGLLGQRWAALLRREEQLESAQKAFDDAVAIWETQRRLWEADLAERVAQVEARELKLGTAPRR